MGLLKFDPKSDRIALACRRLADAYARRPGAEVPVVEPGVYESLLTTQETVADLDLRLTHVVNWANNLAATDNDWPPVILGYCSVVMVPEAFGCEVVFMPGQSPWARHALVDISGVWHLKPQPVGQSPMIRRHFEWLDYAQRRLGADVPMWTLDIQSPFSTAAQIVEPQELLAACYTESKAVHHLCDLITDYWIEFMQEVLRRTEHPGFPGANFPCISENIGLVMADDTPLIMLSPEMYREFALPYNCRIGEVFGRLHIHSCGDYRHNLDNLMSITCAASIQVHAGPGEFPLPATTEEDCPFNRARNRMTLFVDTNDVARGDPYRARYREHYAEYVLPRLCASSLDGVILQACGCPPGSGLAEHNEALRWTRHELARQSSRAPTAS